jgi:glycosylphosphatidylinositol deacylase
MDVWRDPLLDGTDSADMMGSISAESQLEVFHQRQGLLLLHLAATLMYIPSMVAWIQV